MLMIKETGEREGEENVQKKKADQRFLIFK